MNYIGICDDQTEVVNVLEKMIAAIQEQWGCEWEILSFTSGEELLKHIQKIDVVFLDIEMPKMDGIQVGNKIKRKNPDCKIIMATGMTERFKDAFRIQAFRFVTKPFDKEEIEEALTAFLNTCVGTEPMELYYNRNAYTVFQKDIQYIQAFDGYAEFITKNLVFRKEIALNDLEQRLDDRIFCRIDRKYIINFRWVDNLKDDVLFLGGRRFHISRRKKKEVEKKYIEYDLKYR